MWRFFGVLSLGGGREREKAKGGEMEGDWSESQHYLLLLNEVVVG